MCRKWTKEEKEELRQQLALGIKLKNVLIPGRNHESIRNQAVSQLKLIPPIRNPGWSAEQEAKLKELRWQGVPARKIAALGMLGAPYRTLCATRKRCSKLELGQKSRSEAGKNRKIWRKGEKEEFLAFLHLHSAKFSPDEIAEKLGVKKSTVAKWQRELGVKLCLQETIALPCVRERLKKSYREKGQKYFDSFEKRILEREKKLLALLSKMREKRWIVPPEEKRCRSCGQAWLKHRDFFFRAIVKTHGLTCWYFYPDCKICVAKQRHEKKLALRRKESREAV